MWREWSPYAQLMGTLNGVATVQTVTVPQQIMNRITCYPVTSHLGIDPEMKGSQRNN